MANFISKSNHHEKLNSYKFIQPLLGLRHALRSGPLPSLNYSLKYTNSYLINKARQYGNIISSNVKKSFTKYKSFKPSEPLCVGFVSGDLRNHPVGFFLEGVLSQIDKSVIKPVAYITSYKKDSLTERIKSLNSFS